MNERANVVICGAGIAGIATAYDLVVRRGIQDVVLIDRRAPLTLTSDKSGECYRNWWPNSYMAALINRSIDLLEVLAHETGNPFQMNRRGYAYVSSGKAEQTRKRLQGYDSALIGTFREHDQPDAAYTLSASEGFDEERTGADILLNDELISRHFPHLSDTINSVIHVRRAGWFSAQQLGMTMLEKARQAGLREIRGDLTAVDYDEQGIRSVTVTVNAAPQIIQTQTFVNAAGPFQKQVAALIGVDLPVDNVLHQKMVLRDIHGVIPRNMPFMVYVDPQYLNWTDEEREFLAENPADHWLLEQFPGGLHIRPEGGEESDWVKMGWAYHHDPAPPVEDPQLPETFPDVVIRGAVRAVPGLEAYVNNLPADLMYDGGFYTKTKENLPIIGALPVPGAYLVGALSGFGLMAASAAGELVGLQISGGTLPDYTDFFALSRYDDPQYQQIMAQISASGEL